MSKQLVHEGDHTYSVQRFNESEQTYDGIVKEAMGLAQRNEMPSVDGILVVKTSGRGGPPNGESELILRRGR